MSITRRSAVTIVSVVLFVLVAFSESQSCGKRKVVSLLIHNGNNSKDGFWPWHAVLYHKSHQLLSYACGGSIIDQNTILTAAHCLVVRGRKIALELLIVHVGRSRLWNLHNWIQQHDAYELIVHPDYNAIRVGNDLALIKLSSDISYNQYVQPICLWDRDNAEHKIVGNLGTVIGFGLDESDMVSESLREARLPVVSLIQCLESNPELFGTQLTSRMICAGNRDGIGPCNGDSGGGLFFNFNNVWYIRGMVSFTKPREDTTTCDLQQYTVLTDIAKYSDWIRSHLRRRGELSTTYLDLNIFRSKLLPVATCGYNPYADREEALKPRDFAYPWFGVIYINIDVGFSFIALHAIVVLINDRYVLSTASIVNEFSKAGRTLLNVTLGEHEANNPTHCGMVNGKTVCASVQNLRIEKFIVHEEFKLRNESFVNDIALIRLLDRADLSRPNVKPICLPFTAKLRNEMPTEYVVTMFPSGGVGEMATLLDTDKCKRRSIYDNDLEIDIESEEICVSVEKNVTQSSSNCTVSDTGLPLQAVQQVFGQQRYVLHGLSALVIQQCNNSKTMIFLKVAPYIDWILDNIQS